MNLPLFVPSLISFSSTDIFRVTASLVECTREERVCDPMFVVRSCENWWNLRKSISIWRE